MSYIEPNKLGSVKRSAEGDFVPELSFAFRNAFSTFLDIMREKEIGKENKLFNIQFKEQFPTLLKEELQKLYYKFTVGRYKYLNSISYDEFLSIVMPFMVTTDGVSFYNNLKDIVLQAAEAIQKKLPTPKQEAMNKEKALKVKVLVEKLLSEAKTIKENTTVEEVRELLGDNNPKHIYQEPKSNVVIVILGEYESGSSQVFDVINDLEEALNGQVGYDFVTAPGDDCPNSLKILPNADLYLLGDVRDLYQNIWELASEEEEDELDENEDDSMDGTQEINEYTSNKTTKDNSPRPNRMARPDISGMTKNAKAYWDLYIQDEAEAILMDKYGEERGKKYFEGLLNAPRFGGFYQAVTEIVMQKAKMYDELGERYPNDYFHESWFSVWKRWMAAKGKPFKSAPNTMSLDVTKSLTPKQKDAVGMKPTSNIPKQTSATTLPTSTSYEPKDKQRIEDIMTYAKGNKIKAQDLARLMANKIKDKNKALRRAAAAEDENYHDLANIFLKRAMQL